MYIAHRRAMQHFSLRYRSVVNLESFDGFSSFLVVALNLEIGTRARKDGMHEKL